MNDWCILRMAPSRTLALVDALADAGFDVWTPVEMIRRRRPRSREDREIRVAILATFVFARADQVDDLAALALSPSRTYEVWDAEQRRLVERSHPPFSIFRHGDRIPLIADGDLEPLRAWERKAEWRAARNQAPPKFVTGELVEVPGDAFASMNGVVVETKGRMVLVAFPGWQVPVKIAPWNLERVQVQDVQPEQAR